MCRPSRATSARRPAAGQLPDLAGLPTLATYAALAISSLAPAGAQNPSEVLTFNQNGSTASLDLIGVPEAVDSVGGGDLARNGQILAAADFDDDGYLDLVIGVPLEDVSTNEDAGVLYVVPGGPNGPDATAPGEQIWDQWQPATWTAMASMSWRWEFPASSWIQPAEALRTTPVPWWCSPESRASD